MDGNSNAFLMENDPATMDFDSPEFKAAMNGFDSASNEDATSDLGTDADDKQDETGAPSGHADAKNENAQQGDPRVPPAGVLSADGKHIIPYPVLKGAREEADRVRQLNEELAAQVESLKAQLAQKPGDTVDVDLDTDGQDKTDALNERLKQLAEDFPEFGEVAKTLTSRITALQGEVNAFKNERQAEQHDVARRNQLTVREAIDNNPDLVLWEAEAPKAWDRAVKIDVELRQDPEWVGKPIQERFNEVVRLTRAYLPDAPKPIASAAKETRSEIDQRVSQALKEAGDFVPESLTHIPGGHAPASNDGRLDNVIDMEAAFERMTPEQQDAYLAKFG
jgi:gas vesicle protein